VLPPREQKLNIYRKVAFFYKYLAQSKCFNVVVHVLFVYLWFIYQ